MFISIVLPLIITVAVVALLWRVETWRSSKTGWWRK